MANAGWRHGAHTGPHFWEDSVPAPRATAPHGAGDVLNFSMPADARVEFVYRKPCSGAHTTETNPQVFISPFMLVCYGCTTVPGGGVSFPNRGCVRGQETNVLKSKPGRYLSHQYSSTYPARPSRRIRSQATPTGI